MKLRRRRRRRRPVAQTQTLICTPSVCAWSLEAFFRLVWPARSNQRHCPRADALSKEPVPANRLPICPRLPTDCTFFFFFFFFSLPAVKVVKWGRMENYLPVQFFTSLTIVRYIRFDSISSRYNKPDLLLLFWFSSRWQWPSVYYHTAHRC